MRKPSTPGFVRCTDDFPVFVPAKPRSRAVLAALRRFLHERLRLQLREDRTLRPPPPQDARKGALLNDCDSGVWTGLDRGPRMVTYGT